MLESFLVAGPPGARHRRRARLRAVDHRRVHGLGHDRRACWRSWPRAVRARRARMRIAVLGVGLIGGSIGLAARHVGPAPRSSGFGRDPGRLERARELGAIDTARELARGGARGRRPLLRLRAGGRAARPGARRALAAAPETAWSPTSARRSGSWSSRIDDPRFVGGHPIAGAETAGVEHARADLFQGAVWYLTPTRALLGAALRAPAPLREGHRRPPGGGRRRDPRSAGGGVQPPAPRAGQRARLPGGRPAARPGRGAPAGRARASAT